MRKKIKVMHLIWNMGAGGAQEVVLNYLRDFQSDPDIELKLFVYQDADNSKYNREIVEKHYNVEYLHPPKNIVRIPYIKRYFYSRIAKRAWAQAVEKFKPDIVHVHISDLLINTLDAIVDANVPIRFDTLHSDPRRFKGKSLKTNRRAFGKEGFIPVCVTKEQVQLARQKYGITKYEILHNGIDVTGLKNRLISKTEARKRLNLSENAYIIAGIGRLHPVKNFTLLIDAFKNVLKKRPEALLIIAGEGEEKDYLQAKVEKDRLADRVCFLGNQEDIVPVYCAADVFAVTSLSESSSLVALEAQVCGVRCVLSSAVPRESIVSETVQQVDKNANPKQWADALLDTAYRGTQVSSIDEYEVHSVSRQLKEIYLKHWDKYVASEKKH